MIECVCEIPQQQELLQNHFQLYHKIISENIENGLCHNVVIGCPDTNWDEGINAEMKDRTSFVWFVDEKSNDFKEKLIARGFTDSGIYQAVIGPIDQQIVDVDPPCGCILERVVDAKTMHEFNELVSATLDIPVVCKNAYEKAYWKASQGNKPLMVHWVAKKEGKVVSTLTTLFDQGAVSFWNGATKEEFRCRGINTALRHAALKDAVAKGYATGISYLMSDGMAFGICKKLGFQTKWRFHAFLSPAECSHHG